MIKKHYEQNSKIFTIDFDTALGKNNSSVQSWFYDICFLSQKTVKIPPLIYLLYPNHLVKLIWNYYIKNHLWDAACNRGRFYFYNQCKKLYNENNYILSSDTYKIPRIIHQIWLGSPLPQLYNQWTQSWRIPGWKYYLWTDNNIKNFTLINQKLFDQSKNFGQRSDILRYEILYKFGGLYIDTDFVCLKPTIFELLHQQFDFYGGIQPLDIVTLAAANGIIGARAKHPILESVIRNLPHYFDIDAPIWATTGPLPFTKIISENMYKAERPFIVPPLIFFPYGRLDVPRHGFPEMSCSHHYWQASWQHAIVPINE